MHLWNDLPPGLYYWGWGNLKKPIVRTVPPVQQKLLISQASRPQAVGILLCFITVCAKCSPFFVGKSFFSYWSYSQKLDKSKLSFNCCLWWALWSQALTSNTLLNTKVSGLIRSTGLILKLWKIKHPSEKRILDSSLFVCMCVWESWDWFARAYDIAFIPESCIHNTTGWVCIYFKVFFIFWIFSIVMLVCECMSFWFLFFLRNSKSIWMAVTLLPSCRRNMTYWSRLWEKVSHKKCLNTKFVSFATEWFKMWDF